MKRRAVLATVAGMFGFLFTRNAVAQDQMASDYVWVPLDKETGDPPSMLWWNKEKGRYMPVEFTLSEDMTR